MRRQIFTICIRCGKARIFSKSWKDYGEYGKGTVIFHEESRCPDTDCQKFVDAKFQEMRDRRALTEERKRIVILERSLAKKSKLATT